MTTIAVNYQCMAGDRRVTDDEISYETPKIFRIGDAIIGVAGNINETAKFLEWWEGGRVADVAIDGEEFAALVLGRDASGKPQIHLFNGAHKRGDPIYGRDFYAIGTGALGAMVAMRLGRKPAAAVKAVAAVANGTGGPVDVIYLKKVR